MLFSPRPVETPARSLRDEETTAEGVPKWVSLNYRRAATATGNLNFIKTINSFLRFQFCLERSSKAASLNTIDFLNKQDCFSKEFILVF